MLSHCCWVFARFNLLYYLFIYLFIYSSACIYLQNATHVVIIIHFGSYLHLKPMMKIVWTREKLTLNVLVLFMWCRVSFFHCLMTICQFIYWFALSRHWPASVWIIDVINVFYVFLFFPCFLFLKNVVQCKV